MNRSSIIITLTMAAALLSGVPALNSSAQAHPTGGWGMMGGYGGGYGPGMMGGYDWGHGPGMMSGDGPGYGPGMMGGYGRGWMHGNPGYAPGYGQGPDSGRPGDLSLSTSDVRNELDEWLAGRGNPRLKVGDVTEKSADTIQADIVTKDNSLVERFIVNRHTGYYRPSGS